MRAFSTWLLSPSRWTKFHILDFGVFISLILFDLWFLSTFPIYVLKMEFLIVPEGVTDLVFKTIYSCPRREKVSEK